MNARILAALAVGTLLLLAGCTVPTADTDGPQSLDDDQLGYVDGYWYNDTVDVDTSDGLDQAELDAVTRRAMARIERERNLEFERTVPVEVVSREEFQQGGTMTGAYDEFDEQFWRATFIVGDDSTVDEELDALYGSAVQGYYTTEDGGRIVLVADDPEAVTVDRSTLVHELVHALQHQHFGITRETATRDERLAWLGLVEGEANYLMDRYEERCGDEWDCIDSGDGEPGPAPERFNEGLYLTIFHPYSDGPQFVHELREREGWEGVDAAHDDPPPSTAVVIDPDRYPDDPGREVTVEDRSEEDWERIGGLDGETETVGQAALFATFWYNGLIERTHIVSASGEYARYSYVHPLTDGWDGDSLAVYEKDGAYGHVFESEWRDEEAAELFGDGYGEVLRTNGAEAVADDTYRIDDGEPFAGAYRVVRSGSTVTVVHAPSVEELDEVHAVDVPVTASVERPTPSAADRPVAASAPN